MNFNQMKMSMLLVNLFGISVTKRWINYLFTSFSRNIAKHSVRFIFNIKRSVTIQTQYPELFDENEMY